MESEMSVTNKSIDSLEFDWVDNSGCAAQLTSFNFNILAVTKTSFVQLMN